MLRYKISHNKETKLKNFPVSDLFVSSDLSYISGYTDTEVGLTNGEEILIESPYLNGSEINTINVSTVNVQGKANLKLKLPVKQITKTLVFPIYTDSDGRSYILVNNNKEYRLNNISGDSVVSSVTQNYIEYNGDICYFFGIGQTGYLIGGKYYAAYRNDKYINIDIIRNIEDGKLEIGDYTYHVNFFTTDGVPTLRLDKNHSPISNGDMIGLIDGNKCYFDSIVDYESDKWKKATKFFIKKANNPVFNVSDTLYGGYKHYVTFNDENYYLRKIYDDNNEYIGYGVVIDDVFYEATPNYGNYLYEEYNDLPYAGSYIYMPENDQYLEIYDTIINQKNGGCFLLLIGSDEGSDVTVGNVLIAESNEPIEFVVAVDTDTNLKEHIAYQGKRYEVEKNICDTVEISDGEFPITYLNDDMTSASTIINGDIVYFDILKNSTTGEIEGAKLSNKIYYKSKESDGVINLNYGINNKLYKVTENSGVTINGKNYIVYEETIAYKDENNSNENVNNNILISTKYAIIRENVSFELEVTDVNGSSTYIAYPIIDDDTIEEDKINQLQREYCNVIVNHNKSFSFYLRKDTFGDKTVSPENGLMNSMSSDLPYTISNNNLLEKGLKLYRIQNFLSFNLPMVNKIANNLNREDVVKNDFVDYIKKESINTIVDMEKDVYTPVWTNNDRYGVFYPIQQIRFNLHFRTRNFDNWKVYEDDREFSDTGNVTPNSVISNWFITDLNYYKNNYFSNTKKYLHNSSDLLGLIGFTTDEIKNQASKIGKSFLRLSFYSTNDPKTQVLLSTSTIFLDEGSIYSKYANSKRNSDLIYVDVKNGSSSVTINNLSEVYRDKYFNDGARLSSRIIVNDKYNTNTSSDGYYLYLFKDYGNKTRKSTIYLKVDFNHAGIGKTISFMLPRVTTDSNDGISRPLYIHRGSDLNILKNGFKLTDIYKQTYIPINLIYDSKENKYVYYLPSILRENTELGVENEIMEFNLFETKFANESIVENES